MEDKEKEQPQGETRVYNSKEIEEDVMRAVEFVKTTQVTKAADLMIKFAILKQLEEINYTLDRMPKGHPIGCGPL